MDRQIVLIAHNLRSCHNVGSLLRTAEGLGAWHVYLSGYTPYPLASDGSDSRLPHLAHKLARQIRKTALGAEKSQPWSYVADVQKLLDQLKADGFTVCAVEQAQAAVSLPGFVPPDKVALIVGREVEGIEAEILALAHTILEIPMFGSKESFNVTQAAAIAMYHCRFAPHKA